MMRMPAKPGRPPQPPLGPGRAEAAVAAELAGLPAAEQRPTLVEIAKVLEKDLDNESFAASHSSLNRELGQGVRSRGKLAAVQALSAKWQ